MPEPGSFQRCRDREEDSVVVEVVEVGQVTLAIREWDPIPRGEE